MLRSVLIHENLCATFCWRAGTKDVFKEAHVHLFRCILERSERWHETSTGTNQGTSRDVWGWSCLRLQAASSFFSLALESIPRHEGYEHLASAFVAVEHQGTAYLCTAFGRKASTTALSPALLVFRKKLPRSLKEGLRLKPLLTLP